MILEPFNGLFFILFGCTVLTITLIGLLFRNASEHAKKVFLIGLCAVNIVIFWIYKYFLSIDAEYATVAGFSWWSELPLHLCNINMIMIPIGVLTKKRGILGFSFFLAPLGAIMACVFPSAGFAGYSLALPRMWGFYATHLLIIVCGISLATLNFYRPKIKDLPSITVTFLFLAVVSLGINALLQNVMHCATANYFYTWGPNDISILELFWKWIPIRFVYELPALAILFTYVALVCGGFKLGEWIKNAVTRKKGVPADEPLIEDQKETVNV